MLALRISSFFGCKWFETSILISLTCLLHLILPLTFKILYIFLFLLKNSLSFFFCSQASNPPPLFQLPPLIPSCSLFPLDVAFSSSLPRVPLKMKGKKVAVARQHIANKWKESHSEKSSLHIQFWSEILRIIRWPFRNAKVFSYWVTYFGSKDGYKDSHVWSIPAVSNWSISASQRSANLMIILC